MDIAVIGTHARRAFPLHSESDIQGSHFRLPFLYCPFVPFPFKVYIVVCFLDEYYTNHRRIQQRLVMSNGPFKGTFRAIYPQLNFKVCLSEEGVIITASPFVCINDPNV